VQKAITSKTEKKTKPPPFTPRGKSRPAFIHLFLPGKEKEKEEEEEEEEGNPSSRERKRKSGAERRGEEKGLVLSRRGKKPGTRAPFLFMSLFEKEK
jgi:hypothetical protein